MGRKTITSLLLTKEETKVISDYIDCVLSLKSKKEFKNFLLSSYVCSIALSYAETIPNALDGFYAYKENDVKKKLFAKFSKKFTKKHHKTIEKWLQENLKQEDKTKPKTKKA